MKKKTKKANVIAAIALVLIAGAMLFCLSVTGSDGAAPSEVAEINAAPSVSGRIANPVIVICFKGEDVESCSETFTRDIKKYFTGETNSLDDYYREVSYGTLKLTTVFPEADGNVFVYEAPKTRSQYRSITEKTSASKRYAEESALLNGAVAAANAYFDFTGLNLDVDNDGNVDSVSFIVSGSSTNGSGWGGLLWPHSWELVDISKLAGSSAAKLNGKTVNSYSFNFVDSLDVGYLCHETGHVLGMPDLYHYDYDKERIQVGHWDIMHLNVSAPQYPTVYMREKYLGAIGVNQIVEPKTDGEYTLKPVTAATAEDIVAYRVDLNENESVYFEYRLKRASGYDSEIPASGLLVYRVNRTVEGNTKGRYENAKYPDEVFVYRPKVYTSGGLRQSEIDNLSLAALSLESGKRRSLGVAETDSLYDPNAIYKTNGENTGIVVAVTEQSDEEIKFRITLNGNGNGNAGDLRIEGATEINYGEPLAIIVKVKLFGRDDYVIASPSSYEIEYDSELIGRQQATVTYHCENGEPLIKTFEVVISDALTVDGFNLSAPPDRTEYSVGDGEMDLTGLRIALTYLKEGSREISFLPSEKEKWRVEGVNFSASGKYTAKVTYLPFDRSVYFTVRVAGQIAAIRIAEKDTTTLLSYREYPRINVEAIDNDGVVTALSPELYEIIGFPTTAKPSDVFVTVRLKSDSSISCTKELYLVDENEIISVRSGGKIKTEYLYGETLRLVGGTLIFDVGGREITVPSENYYGSYSEKYSELKKGRQVLSVSHYGIAHEYVVTVLSAGSSVLVSGSADANVFVDGGYVLFDKTTALRDCAEIFSSYLNIKFVKREGAVEYLLNGDTDGDALMCSSMFIVIYNDGGREIAKLGVFVKGDSNGDGVADSRDAEGWADALCFTVSDARKYLDMNGDGQYTLTDYVLLKDTYGGKNA